MNQTKGLKRNTIDKYYTKDDVVAACLEQFKTHVFVSADDFVIEPSAGNGAFINGLEALFPNKCLFYDLEPEHPDIVKQDYLTWEPNDSKRIFHVIGNPPFGRQASLAIQFIKNHVLLPRRCPSCCQRVSRRRPCKEPFLCRFISLRKWMCRRTLFGSMGKNMMCLASSKSGSRRTMNAIHRKNPNQRGSSLFKNTKPRTYPFVAWVSMLVQSARMW